MIQPEAPTTVPVPLPQRILVMLTAVASTFLTIIIWSSVSGQQGMWPLPGLYFLELPAAAIAAAVAYLRREPSRALMAWISAGIYAAFSVLGAFSVGFFYLPITILLVVLAVFATPREEQGFLRGVVAFVIAALMQAALMFLLINLLYAA